MIYSDDAPSLENHLHKVFNEKQVNKINSRKEFFNVNLKKSNQLLKIWTSTPTGQCLQRRKNIEVSSYWAGAQAATSANDELHVA